MLVWCTAGAGASKYRVNLFRLEEDGITRSSWFDDCFVVFVGMCARCAYVHL